MFPRLLVAAVSLTAVVAATAGAQAEEAFELRLERAHLEADGTTTLTVGLTGPGAPDVVPAGAVTVIENGAEIPGVAVTPIRETVEGFGDVTVMILFDVSGSMEGAPMVAARDAASDFVRQLVPEGITAGLTTFGSDVRLAHAPTDDVDALVAAIQAMEARGRTLLYDAIVEGSRVLAGYGGERTLVLFTDGGDNGSEATLDQAIAAANELDAPIVNVALITPDQDPVALDALAERTDGLLFEVDELEELSGAFAEVVQTFTDRHVISYRSTTVSDELDLEVTVRLEGATSTVEAVLLNPREHEVPPLPPAATFQTGVFGTDTALYAALATVFVALALLLLILTVPRSDPATVRTLRRGLTMTERPGAVPREESGLSASVVGQRALDLVTSIPKPEGYDERRQLDLERAGWSLRSSEYNVLRLATALGGGALLWALSGSWLAGVIGFAAGFLAPGLLLHRARQRRQRKFMEQLPNALQVLAGTLKAGYGPLQGIATIVQETTKPMSVEFQRVLTEARLGLSLDEALNSMAERIDDDDFRWVVVAMNIQRQAGGNLAGLMETVAATLREREQTRRQIDVLSAEGKLSAGILTVLPIAMALYLLVVNPTYLLTLVTNVVGLILAGSAVGFMLVGVVWMRKMIRIEV